MTELLLETSEPLLTPLKDVATEVQINTKLEDQISRFQITFAFNEKKFATSFISIKDHSVETVVSWCVDCVNEINSITNRLANFRTIPDRYVDVATPAPFKWGAVPIKYYLLNNHSPVSVQFKTYKNVLYLFLARKFYGVQLWKKQEVVADNFGAALDKCRSEIEEESQRVLQLLFDRAEIHSYFGAQREEDTRFMAAVFATRVCTLYVDGSGWKAKKMRIHSKKDESVPAKKERPKEQAEKKEEGAAKEPPTAAIAAAMAAAPCEAAKEKTIVVPDWVPQHLKATFAELAKKEGSDVQRLIDATKE